MLAGVKPSSVTCPSQLAPDDTDIQGAAMHMARLYWERFPFITDWANVQGKTALHIAALRGSDEFVRVRIDGYTCDFADPDDTGRCCATSAQILIYPTFRGTPLFISEPTFCRRLDGTSLPMLPYLAQAHGVIFLSVHKLASNAS